MKGERGMGLPRLPLFHALTPFPISTSELPAGSSPRSGKMTAYPMESFLHADCPQQPPTMPLDDPVALHQPRAELAGVQSPRAGGGAGPAACRCWSGSSSWPSSARTSTSSSWSASAACSRRCRPASPSAPAPTACRRASSSSASARPSASWSPTQYRCLREEVLPALEREGIVIRGAKDLTDADRKHLRDVFRREIFPVLTPLAIDPGHPFPHLLNKSLNLAVLLQRPQRRRDSCSPSCRCRRCCRASCRCRPSRGHVFTPLETVIRLHLPDLFPGMELEHGHRLPRHAQQRVRDRRRRSRGPAQDDRGGGPQAPPRRRGAAGDRGRRPARGRAVPDAGRSTSTRPTSTASRACST